MFKSGSEATGRTFFQQHTIVLIFRNTSPNPWDGFMHPQGVGALLLGEPLSNLTAVAPEIYEFRYELICFSQSTELTQKRKETAYEKTRC